MFRIIRILELGELRAEIVDVRVQPGVVMALLRQLVLEAPLRSCAPIVHLPERVPFPE